MVEQSRYQPFPTQALEPGSAGSSPQINVNASANAFGAPIAHGLQQLGQAGMQAAEVKQTLANELYANDASVQGMRGATKIWDWYGKLEGRAPQDAREQFQRQMEENYKRTIDAAPNDASKAMLLRPMRSITDRYLQYGESYADSQFKKWTHESHANRALELGNQAAVSRYHDQEYMEALVEAGVQQALIPKRNAGVSGDELTAIEKHTRGALYKPIIEMMANEGQVRRASELFDAHRNKFDNASQLQIESFLRPKIEAISAESIGKRAIYDITSQLETGAKNPLVGVGNITHGDKGGASAYGNWGLQGHPGQSNLSVNEFIREQDPDGFRFGLTARPGTSEFDRQWRTAAREKPEELHRAEIAYHDKHITANIVPDLKKAGVSDAVARDPRVQAYISDRNVQYGDNAVNDYSSRIRSAAAHAGDDPVQFIRNLSLLDKGGVEQNFHTWLREHRTKGERRPEAGLYARVERREKLALGISADQPDTSVTELAIKAGMAPSRANAYALGIGKQEEGLPVSAQDRHEFYSGGKGETLQRAAEIAEREHPDNPHVRQMALNQVREYYNMLAADAADEERAERLAEKQRKAQQEAAEAAYLQDFYSDAPKMTAKDIVADPRLDAAAKEKMIAARTRALREDREEALSVISARNTPIVMKRITDDMAPDRIRSKNDIREEFYAGNINRSDLQYLEKVFDEVRSPDGGPIVRRKEDMLQAASKTIMTNSLGIPDDQRAMQAFYYRAFVEKVLEETRAKGTTQDVMDLFTPSSPKFLGKPEILQGYQRSITEIINDKAMALTRTSSSRLDEMKKLLSGAPQ